MSDPAGTAKDAVRDELAALKAELGELLNRARAASAELGPVGEELMERGRAGAEAADAYVRKSPLSSAAIAFLAGCLIGRLLR
jgi:ElaB/YqjD/DUF883 family membrane-anchored ribosome-binding protein